MLRCTNTDQQQQTATTTNTKKNKKKLTLYLSGLYPRPGGQKHSAASWPTTGAIQSEKHLLGPARPHQGLAKAPPGHHTPKPMGLRPCQRVGRWVLNPKAGATQQTLKFEEPYPATAFALAQESRTRPRALPMASIGDSLYLDGGNQGVSAAESKPARCRRAQRMAAKNSALATVCAPQGGPLTVF